MINSKDHTMQDQPPALVIDGPVARIRFCRPSRHNLLEPEDLNTLIAHCARVSDDSSIRVLILSAAPPTFSSGFNIGKLGTDFTTLRPDPFEATCEAVEAVRCPTIAAMEGPVYGGAADIALACDFRLGVRGMTLRIPAARIGNHYYGGGLRRMTARLGQTAAARIFLAAATLTDEELLRCGYLSELVAADAFDAALAKLTEALVHGAPLAIDGVKQVINATVRGEFDAEVARRNHQRSLQSEDLKEGRRAFAEKRPPVFNGR